MSHTEFFLLFFFTDHFPFFVKIVLAVGQELDCAGMKDLYCKAILSRGNQPFQKKERIIPKRENYSLLYYVRIFVTRSYNVVIK